MRRNAFNVLLRICFMLTGTAVLLLFAALPADAQENERVTFLSSYSLSFPTVTRQISGIDEAMKDSDVTLSYEFMDSKELDSSKDIEEFSDYLEYKWNRIGRPDSVIVGDDNALQLVISKRYSLFKDIPVIFLGIDSTTNAEAAHKLNMTGITESGPLKANIDLALSIYPDAKRILSVVDDSPSGIGGRDAIRLVGRSYPDLVFDFMDTSKMTYSDITHKLQSLDTSTILLYYIFSEDIHGTKYSAADGAKILFQNSSVPVFYYQIGVGTGSLGGIQVDFEECGRLAGEMALKTLIGTSCSDINIIYDTPTKLIFDYSVMEQYHIKKSQLPSGSEYINYDENENIRKLFIGICVITATLIVILLVLYRDNLLSHHNEKQLLRQQNVLQREADHDELTSLRNRRFLMKSLDTAVSARKPITLIEIDIDHFKEINDTYGHPAGDIVLRELSRRMKELQSENINIYRYGGDEFCVILYTAVIPAAMECAENFHDLCSAPFPLCNMQNINVNISIGFARYPDNCTSSSELLKCADEALYRAKREGKNTIRGYGDI